MLRQRKTGRQYPKRLNLENRLNLGFPTTQGGEKNKYLGKQNLHF
jgi:hypothetical protein